MTARRRAGLLVTTVIAATLGAAADIRAGEAVTLPERGTVIFLGDSITWQNLYVVYVENLLARAFPERRLRFVNLGVRGDTAVDVRRRLDRDVVPRNPALVFVMLGVNDGGLEGKNGRLVDAYLRNMGRLVSDLRAKTKARVVLLTSTCIDPLDTDKREYNQMLAHMAKGLLDLGRKENLQTIDVFTSFCRALEAGRTATPPVDMMADPLHPSPAGHLVVAHTILNAILPDGREAASVQMSLPRSACSDAGAKLLISHNLRNAWLPPEARAALPFAPLQKRFNRQLLVVGDAACSMRLMVNDRDLGTFSPVALGAGIDLNAIDSAPWSRDAERYYRLTQARWRWFYTSWDPRGLGKARAFRDVGGPPGLDDKAVAALAAKELTRVERMIAGARRRAARVYELHASPEKPNNGPGAKRLPDRAQ